MSRSGSAPRLGVGALLRSRGDIVVLRIVFTREDLVRLRFAEAPDPMWELVQSLHHLQEDRPAQPYRDWHRRARHRVSGNAGARELLGRLTTLVPRRGDFPDFLTPTPAHRDIETGCEQVAYTRRAVLTPDLCAVFSGRSAPPWVRSLACGDRAELTTVVAALRGAFDLLVRPHWTEIRATVSEDRANRLRTLSSGGIRALFEDLPGVLGWDGEVLRVGYPRDRTLWLQGRGLTLVASHFCSTNPISLINEELPPTLVHPIATAPASRSGAAGVERYLATLLGRGRADCLSALSMPHTTSRLAGRVGISVGSASKQAATLREAGLVISEREGNAVVHRLSPLGAALLAGAIPAN